MTATQTHATATETVAVLGAGTRLKLVTNSCWTGSPSGWRRARRPTATKISAQPT